MAGVNLSRFFKRIFGVRPSRDDRREERLEKIRGLGYEVQDRSGTYKGQVATRRYFLVSPKGKVLDNDGSGYASSSEAFRAAMADLKESKSSPRL